MHYLNHSKWWELLDENDLSFIRRFVLKSGSLKEMAKEYGVSYPTMRNRLDILIRKLEAIEESEDDEYILLIKTLAIENKMDFETARILIQEYRKGKENETI